MNPIQKVPVSFRVLLLSLAVVFLTNVSFGRDSFNSWTNPASGNWEDLKWSLGSRPSTNDSVMITNAGWKAISINPSTVANFPSSMTVSNLTVSGPTDSMNTVLLNFIGSGVPFTILRQCVVKSNGVLAVFNSNLEVLAYSGTQSSIQGSFTQVGGKTRVAGELVLNGQFNLTNGYAQSAALRIGDSGSFIQVGGTNSLSAALIGYDGTGVGGDPVYTLVSGQLESGLVIVGNPWAFASFIQLGGTNTTSTLRVGDLGFSYNNLTFGGAYALTGGRLETQGTTVSSPRGPHYFTQNGGVHNINGALTVSGQCFSSSLCSRAYYSQGGGTLFASSMALYFCYYSQGGGDANIVGNVQADLSGGLVSPGQISLSGGNLNCANFTARNGPVYLDGGTLVVADEFKFSGYDEFCPPCIPPNAFATFTVASGVMSASNIQIIAYMALAPGSNRIINKGTYGLAGYLSAADADEHFGRFILRPPEQLNSPTIILGGTTNRLAFAQSNNELWATNGTLIIQGWSGSTNGGGADQLKFGTNAIGLTAAQLSQIKFLNPDGFPIGTYNAKMLSTGEVVPVYQSRIYPAMNGGQVVLSWSNATALQTSTNVNGPYVDVTGATDPYTNTLPPAMQRFFRLRQ